MTWTCAPCRDTLAARGRPLHWSGSTRQVPPVLRILLNASYAPSLINFRGRLIAALIARGHAVHCAAPAIDRDIRAALEELGAEAHEVPLDRAGTAIMADLAYFFALRALVRRLRVGLVISYTIKPNIWGSLAARSLGVHSVSMVTGTGYTFTGGNSLKRRAIGFLSRTLYRRATDANCAVIFQNPDNLTTFLVSGALRDPSKAHLVNGSGVPLDHFAPAPLSPEPAFLMIARLLKSKGLAEYAEAARLLRARGHRWPVRLAGFHDQGPDGVDARDIARWQDEGLEYLGPLADVRTALAQASVYVLPSYAEGTPRTVLEAMAMGRPIVTTDAPGCRETVEHGRNGLLVPVGDAVALADAMERLGGDRQLRAAMAEQSLALVRAKYSVDEVNRALIALLGL